ncbi:MAG: methylhydantoinase [Actinobacteria bacterium]|nr:MAG: methylhydantoinase [Actinomycetota bacterium]
MTSPDSVRIGVDVGGTFTKAVALSLASGTVIATAVLPTTHRDPAGVAAGVVRAVADVAASVGADRIELVTHSTTQAVNALLEGDVGRVGVVGLGRRPDLKQAEKRTRLGKVDVAPGRRLDVASVFFDVTDAFPADAIAATLARWRREGIESACVAEAFAPDDQRNEDAVADLARAEGLAICTSSELTGLYGLELRAVTAALNASILPIAVRTAQYVADGVRAAGIHAPVMVMRSDAGATDLEGFQTSPVRTLYSGPAASVAGALRYSGVTNGVVVEVGGTSTNVAGIRVGRPALSYVQVASHATALRSVDVRVVGVAGGSMLRTWRERLYGVGPRSAHIAGLPYSCFELPDRLTGAVAEVIAPCPGDPHEYVALRLADGGLAAITLTCAANVLGLPRPDDYCYADAASARVAFDAAGRLLRLPGDEVARRMLDAAGEVVCELVLTIIKTSELHDAQLVVVGGGAGGLGRHVASLLGLDCVVPPSAEIISSIGDALSLVRAERERTVTQLDADAVRTLVEQVTEEALAAGASPLGLDVRVEEEPERGLIRAVATGAVGLQSGALPGRSIATRPEIEHTLGDGWQLEAVGSYWLAARSGRVRVLDRFGESIADIHGEVVDDRQLEPTIDRMTRYRGPITLRPSVWVLHGASFVELPSADQATATDLVAADENARLVVGRNR